MQIDSATAGQNIGIFYQQLRQYSEQGKVSKEAEEERVGNILKQEAETVQPIYNSKGKLIEYEQSEKQIDVMA